MQSDSDDDDDDEGGGGDDGRREVVSLRFIAAAKRARDRFNAERADPTAAVVAVYLNPFTHHLATCLKRTLAGRASEDSGGSDGHESSRRWCHNAGRTPARLACAAQRRRSCCSAAATRLEDPSATSAPCSKKML